MGGGGCKEGGNPGHSTTTRRGGPQAESAGGEGEEWASLLKSACDRPAIKKTKGAGHVEAERHASLAAVPDFQIGLYVTAHRAILLPASGGGNARLSLHL
jgi:hypothetical protein